MCPIKYDPGYDHAYLVLLALLLLIKALLGFCGRLIFVDLNVIASGWWSTAGARVVLWF